MRIKKKILGDVLIIESKDFFDKRGSFSKFFSENILRDIGINFIVKEGFYSVSYKNVIRGMHFQIPPFNHDKLVFVIQGELEDVILDVRKNSPYYGKYKTIKLKEGDNTLLLIPSGFAHGFQSTKDNTIMLYLTTRKYSKEHDSGILWNSFGYDWNITKDPIISDKDLNLINFNNFKTPFKYDEKQFL